MLADIMQSEDGICCTNELMEMGYWSLRPEVTLETIVDSALHKSRPVIELTKIPVTFNEIYTVLRQHGKIVWASFRIF